MESARASDTGAGFFTTRKLLSEYEALMARGTLTGSSDTAQVIPKTAPYVIRRKCAREQARLTRYFSLGDGMPEAAMRCSKSEPGAFPSPGWPLRGLIGAYSSIVHHC
jgi:hypothetical protein